MSDDLEQRLQQAFQSGSLPPAPANTRRGTRSGLRVPVRSPRSTGGRAMFGLLAAALLVATVGALAIGGGSLRPGPTVPTIASDILPWRLATPATATSTRVEDH